MESALVRARIKAQLMQSNRIHEEETAPAWRFFQAEHLQGLRRQVAELRDLIADVRAQVAAVREERHLLLAEYKRVKATSGVYAARSYNLARRCRTLLDTENALALRWMCLLQEQLTLQNERHALLREHTRP
jgi:hypothetical protein